MSRNRFRLQKILAVRQVLEQKLQKEFMLSKREMVTEEEHFLKLKTEKTDFTQKMVEINQPTVSFMQCHYDYLSFLDNKIKDRKLTLGKAQKAYEQKRQQLLEASKERQILEKLREKHAERTLQKQNKEEQKFFDEIASRSLAEKTIL
ncbi:MAG: flagellar export protein FliJ [bacterium]